MPLTKEETDRAIERLDRLFFGERMMGEHDEEGQLSNPLTRDEERDALVKEIVELKGKLSQFHVEREHQVDEVNELNRQIQSIELDRTALKNEVNGLRGNFRQARESWGDETMRLGRLLEEQSRIIKSQGAKLELLQSQQLQPFWVASSSEEGFMVMGPDKTTWFQIPENVGVLRDNELGLCLYVCSLLLKAWKEGKAD